ncbi:AMP-binding protein [Streptomyces sp. NPDC001515]
MRARLAGLCAELDDHALGVSQGLRERGVRPGEIVAPRQPNTAWLAVTFYGVQLAGALVTPGEPRPPRPAGGEAASADAGGRRPGQSRRRDPYVAAGRPNVRAQYRSP